MATTEGPRGAQAGAHANSSCKCDSNDPSAKTNGAVGTEGEVEREQAVNGQEREDGKKAQNNNTNSEGLQNGHGDQQEQKTRTETRKTRGEVVVGKNEGEAAVEALEELLKADWATITPETWPIIRIGLQGVQEYCRKTNRCAEELGQLKKAVQEGARQAANPVITAAIRTPTGAVSWAEKAAGPRRVAGVQEGDGVAKKVEVSRKARTLTMRLKEEGEKASAAKATPLQLVKAFKVISEPLTEQIVAARRLQSGDVLLNLASLEARESLEKVTKWASQGQYKSATVLRQSFTVAVDGMCLARFNEEEKEPAMKQMERENKVLHPHLEIIDFKLPPVAKRPDTLGRSKRYSTVLVSVATTGMHDDILDKGITEGGSLKTTRPWDRAADIRQCYRCQGYGHITTRCEGKTRCAICAGEHDTREHKSLVVKGLAKEDLKCAACEQNGHPAWDPRCPIRSKELWRKNQRIANKVQRYNTEKTGSTRPIRPILRREVGETDKEGWTTATTGGKRRKISPNSNGNLEANLVTKSRETLVTSKPRAGRPTAIATAAKSAGQRKLEFGEVPKGLDAQTSMEVDALVDSERDHSTVDV